MGFSSPRRLGQGQVIQIHIDNAFPVQIDGEPWIQEPGILEITHHGQVQEEINNPVKCLLSWVFDSCLKVIDI